MNVYALGASRNIGYFAAIRLLNKGATVTFLLRNTSVFDGDADIQPHISSGKAKLVQGDATSLDDVARGWSEALSVGNVDFVLFTVGATKLSFSLTQGAVINPHDLCSRAILNVLSTIPESQRAPGTQPKIIAVSSTGVTKRSHKNLPLALKPMYSYVLGPAHVDKFGMEHVLSYCAGMPWEDADYRKDVVPADWTKMQGLPAAGSLKTVIVLRAGGLTDGPAKGDDPTKKPPYTACDDDEKCAGYMITRKDVAHFIVENALQNWDKWQGKRVSLAY